MLFFPSGRCKKNVQKSKDPNNLQYVEIVAYPIIRREIVTNNLIV